jgi:SAM-dependent methyltransferase
MVLRDQAARVQRRARAVWSVANGKAVAALREPPAATPSVTPCDIDEQSHRFDTEDQVDVRDLLSRYTVDELTEAADGYYRTNPEAIDYFFAKPATNVDEASEILACFAQVLAGVRPLAGMRVLDFGAGTGWSSRFLTQLGCEVVVCDVSPTALDVARQLFQRQPVAGVKPEPTFLRFDGHHIDLPDESIDRIFCIDAFHHVPNPADVLREFGRVLRGGGIAGFQEPGPNHSKFPQSQYEMKNYTVIENDIRMRDIAKWAELAGFNGVELAIFTSEPFHTTIEQYEDYLGHGSTVERHYVHQRSFVADRRIFFLSKGGALASDSRNRGGLRADLVVTPTALVVASGEAAMVEVVARNIGGSVWLPSDAPHGPVLLGAHLYDAEDQLLVRDHARYPLPSVDGVGVAPGEQVTMNVDLAVPSEPGTYKIELDLVAELIGWFSSIDSVPVSVHITVH